MDHQPLQATNIRERYVHPAAADSPSCPMQQPLSSTMVRPQAESADEGHRPGVASSVVAHNDVDGVPHHHPKLRLSHIQRSSASDLGSGFDKFSAQRSEYHEAVSRNTESRFNEQLAKSFSAPLARSRDDVGRTRPPSLAATHPSQYKSGKPKVIGSTSTSPAFHPSKRVKFSSEHEPETVSPELSAPPVTMYTDPMWQTSSVPHYWSVNRTILKRDVDTEHGNVTSPTWMIGLPLGGMSEMAHAYPEETGRDGSKNDKNEVSTG